VGQVECLTFLGVGHEVDDVRRREPVDGILADLWAVNASVKPPHPMEPCDAGIDDRCYPSTGSRLARAELWLPMSQGSDRLSAAEATAAADGAVSGSVLVERDVVIDGIPVPGLVFDHPLVRMTCCEQISVARRRLLHAAYATAVLRRRPDAVDTLAAHLARADDPRASGYLRQAAERAAALCANDAADHYYAELTSRLDNAAAEAAWARIDHSDVLQRMGRYDAAAHVLRQAIEDLRRRGDTDGPVLATGRLAEAVTRSGAVAEAAALLDGEQPTENTSALAATVHHLSRTLVCLVVGRYSEGVDAARRARTHAEHVPGPQRRGLLARALQFQAAALALDGRFAEAGPVADEALPHAEAFGDPRVLASVLSVQREQARRSGGPPRSWSAPPASPT
jgi:hypothetical protein